MKILVRRLLSLLTVLGILLGAFPIGALGAQTRSVAEDSASKAERLLRQVQELAVPYNELYPMSALSEDTVLGGNFFLVHVDGSQAYALNTLKDSMQYRLASTKVRVEGNRVVEGDADPVVHLSYKIGTSPAAYGICDQFGRFYCAKKVSGDQQFYLHRPTQNYQFIPSGDGCYIRVNDYDITHAGDGIYYLSNHFAFEEDHLFYLYEVSEILELYRSIKAAQIYLDGNEKESYSPETYDSFLSTLESSLTLYNQLNTGMCREETLKEQILSQRDAMESARMDLTFRVQDVDYIDIPIQVMDFRGDTFMFEFVDVNPSKNWYALRDPVTAEGAGEFPATLLPSLVPTPDGEIYNSAQGLVLPELVNGQMIYQEKTVAYVASLIMIDVSESVTSFMSTVPEKDNKWFLGKIREILDLAQSDPVAALGSMADTVAKTEPIRVDGREEKINGGMLLSENVTTAFDLAYYALNNIWRSVGEDVLRDEDESTVDLPYNIPVPERSRLRLYWDPAQQMYSFNSEYEVAYDGAYIYNTAPLKPSICATNTPRFMPIDGLGFEKDGVETDRSSHFMTQGYGQACEGLNYHYSIRASGSFVYYENQDLYFIFHGDDDVYFFIDGKLVMDLGGAHPIVGSELLLNREKLVELGLDLKDGEIYSFDMFYAERHSSGSNMRLSTNMHIMDTETVTTKGQYLEETDGKSMVDPATGMGDPRSDGAVMNIGDTVAYSFELLNKRQMLVEDISFEDPMLGVSLSAQEIRMPNPERTNGAETALEDIILFYHSYDPEHNRIYSGELQNMTASEMSTLIQDTKKGTGQYAPLPEGSYRVRIATVAELTELLAVGLPAQSQLVVYGFRRIMGEKDMPYINTIRSHCSYKRLSDSLVGIKEELIHINGSASRILRVPDVKSVRVPTAQKLQIVIDYGKPVQISVEDLRERIFVHAPVELGDFVGLTTIGNHGEILRAIPKELYCTASGKSCRGHSGSFTYEDGSLCYRLNKMLNSAEKIKAVFALKNCSLMVNDTDSAEYTHILVELQIIPATTMYYETDFAPGIFATEAVGGAEPWTVVGTENAQEEFQNNGRQADAYPTELSSEVNAESSSLLPKPTEKKTRAAVLSGSHVFLDFDTADEVTWSCFSMTATVDPNRGVLQGNLTGNDPHISMSTSAPPLNYTLQKGDFVQIRTKNSISGSYARNPSVYLLLDDNTQYSEAHAIHLDEVLDNNVWHTMIFPIPESFEGKTLKSLRFDPLNGTTNGGNGSGGNYQIDYIYVGGPQTAPGQNALFFGFTGTEQDLLRYSSKTYGGGKNNFDTTDQATPQWSVNRTNRVSDIIISNDEEGTMTLKTFNSSFYVQSSPGVTAAYPLQYDPHRAEVMQVRFKLSDYTATGSNPKIYLAYYYGEDYDANGDEVDDVRTVAEEIYPFDRIVTGDYVTVTINITGDFRQEDIVSAIRLGFAGLGCSTTAQGTAVIDYIYVGPRGEAPLQDSLYFDFTNTIEDQLRYSNEVYEDHNYDVGTWKGTWRDGSGWSTVTIEDGCITTGMGDHTYAYVQTGGNGAGFLNYDPSEAQIVAVRFKLSEEAAITEETKAYFKFQVIKEGGGTELAYEEVIPFPADIDPHSGFVTLIGEISNEDILNAEFFNSLRVGISELKRGSGTIIFDYIYVGPRSALPSEDRLLFHFTDKNEDRERYSSFTYGYHSDYDSNTTKWIAPYSLPKAVEAGALVVTGTASSGGSYIEPTSGRESYATMPLNYRPSAGDMVQVRFKLTDMLVETGKNCTLYFGIENNGIYTGTTNFQILGTLTEKEYSGEYVVLTAKLNGTFTNAKWISTIRVSFNGIHSADASKPGSVSLDYVYIGPERDLPTPRYTVTYQSESGTVLQTQILHEGESSVFTGTLPTKTHTAEAHYIFSGWVTTEGKTPDLSNITSDLTLKPKFATQNHQWTTTALTIYDPCTMDEVTQFQCTVCNYGKTEMTKAAVGHRYVDGACAVCGETNTATLLHFQKNSPELSFDWSSRNQTGNIAFDTEGNGFLKGTFDKKATSSCYLGMRNTTLTHSIGHTVYSPDEIVQIRIKIDSEPDTEILASQCRMYFIASDMALGKGYDENHGVWAQSLTVDEEGFVILNFPLPRIAVTRIIRMVRLDFLRGNAETGIKGQFAIDYIYLGSSCEAPTKVHSWNKGVVLTEPTCTEEGELQYTCFLCGALDYASIPVEEHRYAPGKTVAPTCSTTGQTGGSFCIYCGQVEVIDGVSQDATVIAPVSHSYDYADHGSAGHIGTCYHCQNQTDLISHSFLYGYCRCGAEEPEYMIYGYDNSYLDDSALSNGTSLFVKGAGVTLNNEEGKTAGTYTRTTFSFTGTGFDIISRTGSQQGTLRIAIYTDKAMRESGCIKSLTVNNKGELELFQIPVASVHGLVYGTYYVAIGVNKKVENSSLSFLDRGNEFYFDAVRIYDPLNIGTDTESLEVYERHAEAYPEITEVRDLLLPQPQFSVAGQNTPGAVFIDASGDNGGDHITAVVSTYRDVGPKNETYLYSGQAVSFKLLVKGKRLPKSLDIGAKTIKGGTAVLHTGIGKAITNGNTITAQMSATKRTTVTATALYYSLNLKESDFLTDANGQYYTYVVITNAGASGEANVLSITDIKAAFDADPNTHRSLYDNVEYVVDGETFKVAEAFLTGTMAELPVDEGIVLRHSLDLASDISVNYVVEKEALAGYDSFYLECSVPVYEGNVFVGYEQQQVEGVEKGNYYYFTLTGLTAVQMNDELRATLHMEKDNWHSSSATDCYSIAAYAYSQLAKSKASKELRSLCAELLRYGSMAQLYKSYRTDALAQAELTEEHSALLRDPDTVSYGNCNEISEDCDEPTVHWAGKALSLDSRVAVKYIVDLSNYSGTEPLSLRITYTDLRGREQTAVLRSMEVYRSEKGYYAFTFDGLLAAELRTVLTAAVYAGENQISPSLRYSPDSYGNNKTGTLELLCKALLSYSDAALSYFQS